MHIRFTNATVRCGLYCLVISGFGKAHMGKSVQHVCLYAPMCLQACLCVHVCLISYDVILYLKCNHCNVHETVKLRLWIKTFHVCPYTEAFDSRVALYPQFYIFLLCVSIYLSIAPTVLPFRNKLCTVTCWYFGKSADVQVPVLL